VFLAEALQTGRGGELSAVQRRQLGVVYTAALSLVSMANDVIELVRGGDHMLEVNPVSFSVSALPDSVHDMVAPMLVGRSVELALDAPAVDRRVGHPVALSRVLLNLVTNAIKFTEDGSVEVAVRPKGEGTLEFSVRDTGPGLDRATLTALA